MLLPRIFEDNFVDRLFDDMFTVPSFYTLSNSKRMGTNIKDLGNDYQLEIELPGFDKKDVNAELKNGYLTVTASRQEIKDEKDDNNKYIRRERYSGSCQRSYYVGDHLKEEDFKASFENGILKFTFPKKDNANKIEEKKYIEIG